MRAWQHHFAAIFGFDALSRVRGFSPPEMALPNHPDVFYEFVRTLKESGYRWVLVQEHTVERVEDGSGIRNRHIPHRLIARNSRGETLSITAIIKTQGSDTKLVAQMQPYYEAKGLSRADNRRQIDSAALATQIADGENGGVMMNEFPPKYFEVMREASDSDTPPVNVTEYLEYLDAAGRPGEGFSCHPTDHAEANLGPSWTRSDAGRKSLEKVIWSNSGRKTIGSIWKAEAGQTIFHGCAVTPTCSDRSEQASALFAQKTARSLRHPSLATGMRCSTCSRLRRAATAIGVPACGPIMRANFADARTTF